MRESLHILNNGFPMKRKLVRSNSKARFSGRGLLPPFRQCLMNLPLESPLPVVSNYSLGTPLTNRHYLRSHNYRLALRRPSANFQYTYEFVNHTSKTQHRKFKTNIPRKGPNFHIHVSVSGLYIPTIGLLILLQENMLRDTWMWKLGLRPRNSFSGKT